MRRALVTFTALLLTLAHTLVHAPHASAQTLADALVIGTIYHPWFQCVREHESDRGGAPLHLGGFRQPNLSGSTASGAYQITNGTWAGLWPQYAGRPAPTRRAMDATPYDQSLIVALVFVKDRRAADRHWNGTGC